MMCRKESLQKHTTIYAFELWKWSFLTSIATTAEATVHTLVYSPTPVYTRRSRVSLCATFAALFHRNRKTFLKEEEERKRRRERERTKERKEWNKERKSRQKPEMAPTIFSFFLSFSLQLKIISFPPSYFFYNFLRRLEHRDGGV